MAFSDDPRLQEAQQKDMRWFIDRLGLQGLKRSSHELVGPCPKCGGVDRFAINPAKHQFLCRHCESAGGKGDGIALVMFVMGLTFPDALTWICGERTEISAAEQRRRDDAAACDQQRRDTVAAKFRAQAIAAARTIWQAGVDPEDGPVRAYLERRGIGRALLPQLPLCLRHHPDLPYMVADGTSWRELHRGRAMLAAIQGPDGRFSAVHRTWLDLSQPRGKLALAQDGKALDVKKVLGSKKGGAIRLATPKGATVLVMGEGIETTLSAMVSGAVPGAAWWAGVDLGNMAGRRKSGPGLKYAGLPAMDDNDAFVPPPWVRRLIYIRDGDSDPRDTRAKLEAGLRRAMLARPGLLAQLVHAPDGMDLNDVLMAGASDVRPH